MLHQCLSYVVSLSTTVSLVIFTSVSLVEVLVASQTSILETAETMIVTGNAVTRLPPAYQEWTHSTTSVAMLTGALSNSSITAIETDILMGYDTSVDPLRERAEIPIAAHPPAIESDLSVAKFIDTATASSTTSGNRALLKHIKLDLKELRVVEPSLQEVTKVHVDGNGKMIYLNADILPGPGNRQDANIDANAFLSTCLRLIDGGDRNVSYFVCLVVGGLFPFVL